MASISIISFKFNPTIRRMQYQILDVGSPRPRSEGGMLYVGCNLVRVSACSFFVPVRSTYNHESKI